METVDTKNSQYRYTNYETEKPKNTQRAKTPMSLRKKHGSSNKIPEAVNPMLWKTIQMEYQKFMDELNSEHLQTNEDRPKSIQKLRYHQFAMNKLRKQIPTPSERQTQSFTATVDAKEHNEKGELNSKRPKKIRLSVRRSKIENDNSSGSKKSRSSLKKKRRLKIVRPSSRSSEEKINHQDKDASMLLIKSKFKRKLSPSKEKLKGDAIKSAPRVEMILKKQEIKRKVSEVNILKEDLMRMKKENFLIVSKNEALLQEVSSLKSVLMQNRNKVESLEQCVKSKDTEVSEFIAKTRSSISLELKKLNRQIQTASRRLKMAEDKSKQMLRAIEKLITLSYQDSQDRKAASRSLSVMQGKLSKAERDNYINKGEDSSRSMKPDIVKLRDQIHVMVHRTIFAEDLAYFLFNSLRRTCNAS